MGKFKVTKRLSLAFLGDGWQDGYIELQPLSYKDGQVLARIEGDQAAQATQVLEFFKSHIIGGKGWDGSTLVELTADDLEDLPVEVITAIQKAAMGEAADPNS